MKLGNVKFIAFAHYSNGEIKCRWFVTEKAMSNWANAQYRKDEEVTVEVYTDFLLKNKFCTFHA